MNKQDLLNWGFRKLYEIPEEDSILKIHIRMKNKMKVNLDNEALEHRENVIINMLTRAELGWELDGLGQSRGFVGFHLLLIRADGKLLLASGCWGWQLWGWQGIPSKMGWESPTDQPKAPSEHPGKLVFLWDKAEIYFQDIKSHNPDVRNFIPLPCHADELEKTNIDNFSNSEATSHQTGILLSQSKIWEGNLTSKTWELGSFCYNNA